MRDHNWVQQQAKVRDFDRICEAVEAFIAEHGYSPTKTELVAITGLSDRSVRRHVQALVAEGRLTEGRGHRTLRLAE